MTFICTGISRIWLATAQQQHLKGHVSTFFIFCCSFLMFVIFLGLNSMNCGIFPLPNLGSYLCMKCILFFSFCIYNLNKYKYLVSFPLIKSHFYLFGKNKIIHILLSILAYKRIK